MNFWIGHSVLGRLVPDGAVSPAKPTHVSRISTFAESPTRRLSANPRQPGTAASSCHTTYAWSQLTYARIELTRRGCAARSLKSSGRAAGKRRPARHGRAVAGLPVAIVGYAAVATLRVPPPFCTRLA